MSDYGRVFHKSKSSGDNASRERSLSLTLSLFLASPVGAGKRTCVFRPTLWFQSYVNGSGITAAAAAMTFY